MIDCINPSHAHEVLFFTTSGVITAVTVISVLHWLGFR